MQQKDKTKFLVLAGGIAAGLTVARVTTLIIDFIAQMMFMTLMM